jgi:hypothetical protein|tara:strand:+ start:559 stop:885 length:327 start_codon:yes stop_codon:yes gene_type:complete
MVQNAEITDVDGLIAFLRAYKGLPSDRQLAFWLGIQPQAIPHWKTKGRVPRYIHLLVNEIRRAQRLKESARSGHFDFYLKDGTPRRFNRVTGVLEEFDETTTQWKEII